MNSNFRLCLHLATQAVGFTEWVDVCTSPTLLRTWLTLSRRCRPAGVRLHKGNFATARLLAVCGSRLRDPQPQAAAMESFAAGQVRQT